MGTVRAVIAEDVPHVREGLRRAIELGGGVEVVAEAGDGLEALALVEKWQPDVVLMDARMPGMDGIEATGHVKNRWPKVRVVVLTMHGEYRADAVRAGADAFLTKGCPIEELLEAVSTHGTRLNKKGDWR